jgi:lysine decarboxylase
MQVPLNVPIYNALKDYIEKNPVPFHMPGHKMGKALPEDWTALISKMDLTEIPGLDNLHFPTGAIKEAQELAASVFGAYRTYFLVNGSSVGIHAAVMTVCNRGDKIIVGRDCHRSVISGVILAGANPVYAPVEVDENYRIPAFLDTDTLVKILEENPDVCAVLVTRPNYYGVCSDMRKIAQITHFYEKVLIVDEAHGAHFKFHSSFPETSLAAGADICVQSAHKTLPALTQSAYLHLNKNFSKLIDIDKLEFNLRLLQTTSPSYLLMSSLDMARALMEQYGRQLLENLIHEIDWFTNHISKLKGIKILREEDLRKKKSLKVENLRKISNLKVEDPATTENIILDKTKIVINLSELGKTGYYTEKFLRDEFHIQVEMADLFNIVCIASIADEKKVFEELLKALKCLSEQRSDSFQEIAERQNLRVESLSIPEQGMEPCRILSSNSRYIKLETSAGRISRDFIVPYPPGVPLLCPGEIINQDIIEYVYKVLEAGGTVNGISQENGIEIPVVL